MDPCPRGRRRRGLLATAAQPGCTAGVWQDASRSRLRADRLAGVTTGAAVPAVVKQPRAIIVPARNARRDDFWFAHENRGLWVVAYRFDPDGRPVQVEFDGYRDADGHRT